MVEPSTGSKSFCLEVAYVTCVTFHQPSQDTWTSLIPVVPRILSSFSNNLVKNNQIEKGSKYFDDNTTYSP